MGCRAARVGVAYVVAAADVVVAVVVFQPPSLPLGGLISGVGTWSGVKCCSGEEREGEERGGERGSERERGLARFVLAPLTAMATCQAINKCLISMRWR